MVSGGFPQLPTTVWKGVWQLLNRAPTRKLDARTLSADLGVQTTAAKQYLKELQKLNILDTEGQPTELADLWRQDPNNEGVISRVLEAAYPESLRQLAPPGDLDREKVVRWFQGEKLGIGAAKNKAATYLMVASGIPDEPTKPSAPPTPRKAREKVAAASVGKDDGHPMKKRVENGSSMRPQLAVNVQVHISADATSEQIDAIFSAMRRYFDESEAA